MTSTTLVDVQNRADTRGIALEHVGLSGLHYPLRIRQKRGGDQTVTASIDVSVGLHNEQRGAHLSSLVQQLDVYRERLFDMDDVVQLLNGVRRAQDERGLPFDTANVNIHFKYFLAKAAPATRPASTQVTPSPMARRDLGATYTSSAPASRHRSAMAL